MPFSKDDPNINRKGRPLKEISIPKILREISSEQDTSTKQDKIIAVCQTAFDQAISGDAHARNWISDRMEGKAVERVRQELTTLKFTGENAEEYVRTYLNNTTDL
tara:strand:- start:276 stop:590 length:315 start_codon:yes stop_codon:yes gene_type:complete